MRAYQERVPLWRQPWAWDRAWIREAARRNTLPAMLLRGLAVASFQAVLWAAYIAWCIAFSLWVIGVL